MLIKNIVYITFGFKISHDKLIFEFVFHTPSIQTRIRSKAESMVNRTRINLTHSIFFGFSPVLKQSPVAKFHHV